MTELINIIYSQGLNNINDDGYYLGSFIYDINGSPVQHFKIQVTH
jgi:hypothetical protein